VSSRDLGKPVTVGTATPGSSSNCGPCIDDAAVIDAPVQQRSEGVCQETGLAARSRGPPSVPHEDFDAALERLRSGATARES